MSDPVADLFRRLFPELADLPGWDPTPAPTCSADDVPPDLYDAEAAQRDLMHRAEVERRREAMRRPRMVRWYVEGDE